MPYFTDTELTTFLTENANIMRLSTIDPDGHPYVTPVWFDYVQGSFNIFTEFSVFMWYNNLFATL